MEAKNNRDKTRRKKEFKLFGNGMLYLLPAIILLSVFLFYPMIKTLYFSFFIVPGGGTTEGFVGLDHYKRLILSTEFRNSLLATFKFVLLVVPGQILVALFLAVVASENLKGMGFFRTIFSSTLGVSVAAGATIWLFLFHPTLGGINQILGAIGIDNVEWLTSSNVALYAIIITTVWMQIGINFIILLAGVQNISREMYESAEIDGAGYWAKLFKITIPLLSPVLFFVLIIAVISSFQTFGQIDLLTGGGPDNSTNLIVYSIYQQAFSYGKFGFASAQAIVLFVIMVIITIIQFVVGERRVHYQ